MKLISVDFSVLLTSVTLLNTILSKSTLQLDLGGHFNDVIRRHRIPSIQMAWAYKTTFPQPWPLCTNASRDHGRWHVTCKHSLGVCILSCTCLAKLAADHHADYMNINPKKCTSSTMYVHSPKVDAQFLLRQWTYYSKIIMYNGVILVTYWQV